MLSIILPVINETFSLQNTINTLLKIKEVKEILIIIHKEKTTNKSKAICKKLSKNQKIKVLTQTKPFLGGAIIKGFENSTQRHVAMMSSDLETDPKILPKMIKYMKDYDIVTVSRWNENKSFEGYGRIKLVLNKIFQKIVGALYRTHLTDLSYGYRIFKTDLVKKIKWDELKHPFLLETILKPLRLGCSIKEVNGSWKKRPEGYSSNKFLTNFLYMKTTIRILFMSKNGILK